MKLEETDDFLDIRRGILAQLKSSGLTELATFTEPGDAANTTAVYIATDVGFYVGAYEHTRSGTLKGELIPWSEVSGTRMVFAGFNNEFSTVLFRCAAPELSLSAHNASSLEFRALVDLAKIAMRNGRGWTAYVAREQSGQ